MKSVETLKKRLLKDNILNVQNEGGHLAKAGFEWNNPASAETIEKFEIDNGIKLPDTYKELLRITNGATLFKDIEYGQWGCNILGTDDIIRVTNEVKDRGYVLDDSWFVFATWLGDGDMLVFDLGKYKEGDKNYILDGDQGYQTDEWEYIKGDFEKWIDRVIVAQGAKYWRWY